MKTIEQENPDARETYWNRYYADRPEGLAVPSQFAVFVLGETPADRPMFDIGCGTGRDALYFASQKRQVVGVDGSTAAVAGCSEAADKHGLASAKFVSCAVDDAALPAKARAAHNLSDGAASTVYARFFLHAINDAEEAAFLKAAKALCGPGGQLAVEFRTVRDAVQSKVTGAHYRRFVNPMDLVARARGEGFRCDYFVEGFGYAKFKGDDAHVARCLFTLDA